MAKKNNNIHEITIKIEGEEWQKALDESFKKKVKNVTIDGFRKGKCPRNIYDKKVGIETLFDEAGNIVLQDAYTKAIEEAKVIPVIPGEVELTSIDKDQVTFKFTITSRPLVTIKNYKGLGVKEEKATVTDEEVEEEVKKLLDKYAELVIKEDGSVEADDLVTIDYEGFLGSKAFEGGKGTDYPLTLGSGSFIPGFEDQLVGAKAGDHVEVKVTFPEEYQAKELAGKEAVFKCAVKKIEAKELPELDDDFAKDVSEFDTLAEYKEHVKTNLVERKENEAKRAKEDAAVDKAIENAQMDIPEAMLQTQCRQMLDDFSRRMQSQGLSMDQYFQFTGMTADKMMEDMKPQALKRIQTRLVLEKVAEVENIQPTEEEVNEEISKMAEAYKMEADKLKELLGERELEQMKKDMAVQKAVTVIADAAKEV